MDILRTPEERFANLADYAYKPCYIEVDNLRMHYVEEGAHLTETVLMLHGEPTWSYLYRKMIPVVMNAGFRVIVPDLIGFGKSDKLANIEDYSYQKHIDWLTTFIKQLDLQDITLVCQDWGGLLGLRVAAENPERFKRISASNTFLPTGDIPASEAFMQWRTYAQTNPIFNIGKIVSGGCVQKLATEIIEAYNAPYPDDTYKAATRAFPLLVPIEPHNAASEANRKAWEVLKNWQKPFMTCFSDSDPITRGGERALQKLIPGAQNQKHYTIQGGGHFVQEDKGEEWANCIVNFIKENS